MNASTKILMVDDDKLTLGIYSKLLSLKGYMVVTSDTAIGIVTTTTQNSPDIILIDHEMPGMTGLEAIKQLKSDEYCKTIPVIYFSSVYNLPTLAAEAGSDAYLSRSSKLDELEAVIQNIIKH